MGTVTSFPVVVFFFIWSWTLFVSHSFFSSIQWWSYLTLTSPLPPAVPAPYLSSLSSHNKGNSTYPFSGHGLIVLSSSIRVPAPHSNYFISVDICLGMTLDWKSPKLHLSHCSETKGPLDRLVNGSCVWWAGLVPCLRSHVTTTTQQRCLHVCLMVFTPAWDVAGGGPAFRNILKRDWCELR